MSARALYPGPYAFAARTLLTELAPQLLTGSLVAQAGLELAVYRRMTLILDLPAFQLPGAGMASMFHTVDAVLGIEPRASCMLDKHSTN